MGILGVICFCFCSILLVFLWNTSCTHTVAEVLNQDFWNFTKFPVDRWQCVWSQIFVRFDPSQIVTEISANFENIFPHIMSGSILSVSIISKEIEIKSLLAFGGIKTHNLPLPRQKGFSHFFVVHVLRKIKPIAPKITNCNFNI